MPGDERPAPRGSGDKGGSYTARPADEPPAEGVTRDEDEEAVERTGGEHEVAQGDPESGSRDGERVPPGESGVG
jgi:hypothetical protein